ncbi:hypothetical protein ANSO36C_39810 [Nostoc cf. commune SO-36]|uniref:GAF domain-containing protein n=1 Tax=Nostoc cf. commune SO-36 TaxID=449208 RepID=A0ABN6Q761_NOSCO|nr:GAF domain-containing protein [Nostoc commune]BDI18179.1 hypothetical protein ANSO36C_39810 [Nostoc cf. commune SO-36]
MNNQIKEIKLLFLNLSNGDDEFRQNREDTLKHIRSIPKIEIEETNSLETAKEKLIGFNAFDLAWDVFFVWIDSENSHIWDDLANFKDQHKELDYLGIIVVFGFNETIQEKARDAMLGGIYAFACPFNSYVLEAYIESIGLEMKNSKSLFKFKKDFLQEQDFDFEEMVENVFLELKTNPIVGYDRATISLIDNKTSERYLLKYDGLRSNPDRQLLKLINEDNLIKNVNEKGVLIIDDLKNLRDNHPEQLHNLGWENEDATNDINSWVGFAAKRQNKSIAIITLDHKTPGHYARYKDKLVNFLKGYSEILADTIVDFLQERNARVVREITREIGDDLKSKALMHQILVKLRDELKCDNCTYFNVSSSIDVSETFLEEWVAANDSKKFEEQSGRFKRRFKKGEGIVGCVLTDGKSRIIPNAAENAEFEPTLHFTGSNLSMLAVPVIPYIDANEVSQSNRMIGVINCYKEKKDHFTIYDRDLVETVAQSTATIIERTMTLEYSNDISSKMNDLVLDKNKTNKTNLLKKICEHALKVTSARAAVIHRLEYSATLANGEETYRVKGEPYAFPENDKPQTPRLDGSGTTDVVIREKKTTEFSESFGNFNCIQEELINLGIKYQIVVPLMIKDEEEKQRLIGALYLNKYSEIPFSEVEKFALELFASQAASTIYHQGFLSERLTWTKANTDLASAIEVIATRDDPALLLRDIVCYAYSLVAPSFSYLALLTDDSNLDYKAAWPESILAELNEFHGDNENIINKNKIGITKLAVKQRKTILIADLHEEKSKNSEYWQEYILFRKETRSELVVPIIGVDKIIGVINLEHEEPYAFTEVHREVIEHFARQVAIAFQKKNLVESVSRQKNILIGLQRSLQKIIESPHPQDMLRNAVWQTREAVGANEVIVFPIQKQNGKSEIFIKDIVPLNVSSNKINALKEVSLQVYYEPKAGVYDDKKKIHVSKIKFLLKSINVNKSDQKQINESVIACGLCVPFSSRYEKIGVMWILFSKPFEKELSEEDKAIYQVYANQIALAYTNAKQSEILKQKLSKNTSELTANIDHNYKDARKQANISFGISICTSLAGLILIFYGVSNLIAKNDKTSQAFTGGSGIATLVGVLLQAVTVLAFDRGKAANERMDRYHKELYNVRQLEILLSATEQLDPETAPKVKQEIIQSATNSWIESVSESNSRSSKSTEVKPLVKPEQSE